MSRGGCFSWPWVSSSIHRDVTAQACESTRAAEHSLHAVRTDNCHLSFPRVSVGGQAQGHPQQNTAPRGLASVHSARGTCPWNALKPHSKRACTTSALLSSPLPLSNPCNCQYHPLPSPALGTVQGKIMPEKTPLTEDLQWQSYKGKKTHYTTQAIVYRHCHSGVILKRSISSELLNTWLQPLNHIYSQTFSFIVLLSFS